MLEDKVIASNTFTFWSQLPSELKVCILRFLDGKSILQSLSVCREINFLQLDANKKMFAAIDFIKSDPFFVLQETMANISWEKHIASKEKVTVITPHENYINLFERHKIDYVYAGIYLKKLEYILCNYDGDILVLDSSFKRIVNFQIANYLFTEEQRLIIKKLKELGCTESKGSDNMLFTKKLYNGKSCSFIVEQGLDKEHGFIWPQYADSETATLQEYLKEGRQGSHAKEFINICLQLDEILSNDHSVKLV